jgi:hypothetical protein
MKKILALILMGFVMMFLPGFKCASVQTKPSVCDTVPEGEHSVICDLAEKSGTTPEMIAGVLKLANVGGLSGKLYTAQEASVFLDGIILTLETLEEGITYTDAVKYILLKMEGLTPEVQALFIVLDDFTGYQFETPQLLSDFDINLLLTHLKEQKALLAPFLMP